MKSFLLGFKIFGCLKVLKRRTHRPNYPTTRHMLQVQGHLVHGQTPPLVVGRLSQVVRKVLYINGNGDVHRLLPVEERWFVVLFDFSDLSNLGFFNLGDCLLRLSP